MVLRARMTVSSTSFFFIFLIFNPNATFSKTVMCGQRA